MAMRPPVRPPSLVLFLSFSIFMAAVLGVLLVAACAGNPDPDGPQTAPPPADGAVAANEPKKDTGDPWIGVEERVVTGSGATGGAVLLRSVSAVAFDSADLEAYGAPGPSYRRRRASIGHYENGAVAGYIGAPPTVDWNTERYDEVSESGFLRPVDSPLSTFSIDVDTASYANVRRFLREQTRPPQGAVRIEELVNYFRYPSRIAAGDEPFAVDLEIFEAPWRTEHRLVRIAVEGRAMPKSEVPPRNLVFLIDVSGSMQGPDRLDLVKYGLARLTETLRPIDRVSIVVYAGASGLVLPPTAGDDENTIVAALDRLHAGGSTAGAEGIRLAYATAREHFDPEGINRIILATDGDFNVGISNRSDLVELIEKERESGIFLTVLGVGRGNLNDAGMEQLADHGNGNYAYLDNRSEARKVLVEQADSTLVTIAKDVKIQVEFNPRRVKAYRLIGYENRRLADQDFNDDTKDAGEIGAGHHVTALYEIVPADAEGGVAGASVDPLKYQERSDLSSAAHSDEWLTVKLRFKAPDGHESQLISVALAGQPGSIRAASENARFSTAVALFGMLLRDSEFKGAGDYALVAELAKDAVGQDEYGERREFLQLVDLAQRI